MMTSSLTNILQFFFLSISLCLTPFLLILKVKETGLGVHRLIFTVTNVLLTISFFIAYSSYNSNEIFTSQNLFSNMLIATILVGCFHFFLKNEEKTFFSKVVIICYFFMNLYLSYLWTTKNQFNLLFFLSSALMTGTLTYAMLLGHWYLVVPKLSETYLLKSFIPFIPIALLKFFYSNYQFFKIYLYKIFSPENLGFDFNVLIILMRIFWGYIILFVLSYFTYRLIKLRSIQSATGVLYVMVFFVFVGELISIYYYFTTGLMI